jgi:hypothetical protein
MHYLMISNINLIVAVAAATGPAIAALLALAGFLPAPPGRRALPVLGGLRGQPEVRSTDRPSPELPGV